MKISDVFFIWWRCIRLLLSCNIWKLRFPGINFVILSCQFTIENHKPHCTLVVSLTAFDMLRIWAVPSTTNVLIIICKDFEIWYITMMEQEIKDELHHSFMISKFYFDIAIVKICDTFVERKYIRYRSMFDVIMDFYCT